MGGCLLAGLAGLLALAIPASIARTSLVGAYILIAIFAVIGVVAVLQLRKRRRPAETSAERALKSASPVGAVVRVGVIAIAYAALVTVIHVA